MTIFKPEGSLIHTAENDAATRSLAALEDAMERGTILEGRAAVCDYEHNLAVELGELRGFIPRVEGALGIREGTTRDIAIISRTGKPVCFVVTGFEQMPNGTTRPLLSRRAVQQRCLTEYIKTLDPGDIIDCRVTHLEPFGCFVDIGCGIPSLIPIDAISISRISHPGDRFRPGQELHAVVKGIDNTGRVSLSHKELLGSWEENSALFHSGETVAGIIRSVEDYGVFVELTPNLAGLAEPCPGVHPGQHASVYIKNLIPEKMKVKLIVVDAFEASCPTPTPLSYFTKEGHLDRWRYSPSCSDRVLETIF